MKIDIPTIKRYQTGDLSAFEEIVHSESARMLNFIRRYVRSTDLADDLLQETWLTVWKIREQLRDPSSFRAWSYQISRNVVYAQMRAKNWKLDLAYYGETEIFDSYVDDGRTPSEIAERQEWRTILNREIAKLDSKSQEMIMMHFEAGLTLREISESLNVPYGTVCVKVHRGIKKLRVSLDSKGLKYPKL